MQKLSRIPGFTTCSLYMRISAVFSCFLCLVWSGPGLMAFKGKNNTNNSGIYIAPFHLDHGASKQSR